MSDMPSFSIAASLIADPARALMLTALLDGRALPAGELAYAANVTPQTASSHLGKLLDGGLVACESESRHRYYRLAGPKVAQALEQLSTVGVAAPVRRKALSREGRALRFCRCCYDHLAGQVGVALCCGLQQRGHIAPAAGKRFEVTAAGADWFAAIGLDVCALRPAAKGLARQCLDWTERTHHLAGPLGVELLRTLCGAGWFERVPDSRAVRVTPRGWRELKRHFGIEAVGGGRQASLPQEPSAAPGV
jgi:DNA-binding transcriptional ArsR family regulator